MNINNRNHRRGHSFNGIQTIHLFSNTNSSHDTVSGKLPKLSFESARLATNGIDDLLSSTEGGKHDYDWLLTPPGTPHLASSEGESQPRSTWGRSRTTSNTNASRFSVSQSENNNHTHSRPARSSSVTRSSNKSSSIPNATPASVSSHTRPSSPVKRSSSAARASTPSSQPSTPSRIPRSLPSPTTNSSSDTNKTRTPRLSRPSTPTSNSRPHIPANLQSPSRSFSRPSTPTRRLSMPPPSPTTTSAPRPRPQPIVPPDFPLETPPNLRTTLPDRPVSAGRSRPGALVTLPSSKANSETQASVTISRRQPSPIVNKGRLSEYTGKSRGHANGSADGRVPHASKLVKSSTTASDNNALGRTFSKKSLDMAIRHTDIRNSSGTLRSLSSATLFPQSIRTSTPKALHTQGLSAPASVNINGSRQSRNSGACFDVGNGTNNKINGREIDGWRYFAKLNEVDAYESGRYDSVLFKEDLNNTNWLRSVDDKCDQVPIFDGGFESLPEPFGLF